MLQTPYLSISRLIILLIEVLNVKLSSRIYSESIFYTCDEFLINLIYKFFKILEPSNYCLNTVCTLFHRTVIITQAPTPFSLIVVNYRIIDLKFTFPRDFRK